MRLNFWSILGTIFFFIKEQLNWVKYFVFLNETAQFIFDEMSRIFHANLLHCYAMLWYAIQIQCYQISMQCYEICKMLRKIK